MSLTTIMYHFVFREPPADLRGIPFLSWENFNKHLHYIDKHGKFLAKGEVIDDFIGENSDHRYLLTFDDSLKCHYMDVFPALEQRGIQAAFSIYTNSVMLGHVSLLERQRYLQYSLWGYDEFLSLFSKIARQHIIDPQKLEKLNDTPENILASANYLSEEHYYSELERFFRYCRDIILEESEFETIIDKMFETYCDEVTIAKALYMSPGNIKSLSDAGHTILGHSVSHPIRMDKLSKDAMEREVVECLDVIENWTGIRPRGFAYPCGRVNSQLFEVVHKAGIQYAFVGGDSSNFNVLGPAELKLFREDAADFTVDVSK